MIRKELKEYIENTIFKEYEKNEKGHGIDHIKYVIKRSLNIYKTQEDLNEEMVYVIAAYHDIGHHIDKDNHEKVSAEILIKDNNLKKFFTEDELKIMHDAVEDHRASNQNEPRNIYGKIVSTADRNVSVDATLKRAYSYTKRHHPEFTEEEVYEECMEFLNKKFGRNGYAVKKIYFDDNDYIYYLEKMDEITTDRKKFYKAMDKIKWHTTY